MYDLRNLFQVNVEEGRHLWAMVYLLHTHFGRDGREEAEALLERRSRRRRQPAHPRRLQRDDARLAGVLHVHLLHRPRRQVPARRRWPRARFDPLARTTKFMLTEEAHHMFVGESGVSRVLQRTAQVMNELKTDDPQKVRAAGAIDLPHDPALPQLPLQRDDRPVRRRPVEQRRDLLQLGPEGPLRGRQARRRPRAQGPDLQGARSRRTASSSRRKCRCSTRSNEVLRDDFIKDSVAGVGRWNKVLEKAGIPTAPDRAAQGVQPQDRRARRHQDVARRPRGERAGMGRARRASGCRRRTTAPSSHR